jgi:ATP-binding cassette subfamily B protein
MIYEVKQLKEEKVPKNKPVYGIVNNFVYLSRNIWFCRKSLLFLFAAGIPLDTADSLLGNFIYSMVVALITEGDPLRFALVITGLKLAQLLLNSVSPAIGRGISVGSFYLNQRFLEKLNRKTMRVGYEYLESKAGQDKRQLAIGNVSYDDVVYNYSGARNFIESFRNLLANILGLVTMSAIITVLNPLILLALFAATLVPYYITNRVMKDEHERREEWSALGRKMNYIGYTLADWSKTKDITLCGIKGLLEKIVWGVIHDMLRWRAKYQRKYYIGVDIVGAVFNVILYGLAYGILIADVLRGGISVAEFTFYFGIITGFSAWLTSLFNSAVSLRRVSLSFCDLREYLDTEENADGAVSDVPEGDTYEITFDNVCYRYNGAEADTLHNISFTIRKSEKIALVGLNGAGKTTLVKLMCGLIRPTSGKITIDGADITTLDRKKLYKLYSVVFQDIFLLPVSVRQNISLDTEENTDDERVREAIRLAGLEKRVSEMADGYDTPLVKSVRQGADDLSGGEKQKLALARALYKRGKLIILDEPTAALDPIAENEMYLQYNEFTAGRTSVFISHRLSSTRFCDRILLVDDGHITETGTHDELMASGGSYAKLFDIQAHYYREGGVIVEEG